MTQEAAVLEALTGVSGWEIDADGLLHLTGGPSSSSNRH